MIARLAWVARDGERFTDREARAMSDATWEARGIRHDWEAEQIEETS